MLDRLVGVVTASPSISEGRAGNERTAIIEDSQVNHAESRSNFGSTMHQEGYTSVRRDLFSGSSLKPHQMWMLQQEAATAQPITRCIGGSLLTPTRMFTILGQVDVYCDCRLACKQMWVVCSHFGVMLDFDFRLEPDRARGTFIERQQTQST